MSDRDLNRAIAQATGESIDTIASLGFVELHHIPYEREPLTVDWDQRDVERNVAVIPQRRHRRRATAA